MVCLVGCSDRVRVRMGALNVSEKIAEKYYDDLGRLVRFSFRHEPDQNFFFALPDLMRKMPDYVLHNKVKGDTYLVEVKGCKQDNFKIKVVDLFHYDAWELFTGLRIKLFIVDFVSGNLFEIPFYNLKRILHKEDIIITQTFDKVNWFEISYDLLGDWKVGIL